MKCRSSTQPLHDKAVTCCRIISEEHTHTHIRVWAHTRGQPQKQICIQKVAEKVAREPRLNGMQR